VSQMPSGLWGSWRGESGGPQLAVKISHDAIVVTEWWEGDGEALRLRHYRAEKIWINEDTSKLIIMCDKSSSENDPMNRFPAEADYRKKTLLISCQWGIS